jgi:surface carbohydrate biosynthesis protein
LKKVIYLPLETKVRELPSRLLLTYFALKRGYSVVIGRKSSVMRIVYNYGSGILILKSGDPELVNLNKNEIFVVINDVEGIIFSDPIKFVSRSNPIDKIDLILVAGELQKKLYQTHINRAALPVIKVIGEPRFDLLNKEFIERYVQLNRMKKINRSVPFVLLPTNFALANPTPYYVKDKIYSKYSKEIVCSAKLVLDKFVEMIDILSDRF